jgi:UDP-N-acetylglucosamine--N-acetylmuramyl-(pentapeptide) pyrophosphoryl-undecaprenol N-acetylglucosamine transferase
MTAPLHIVIAAGGTGGHLFPAEALATALVARGRRVSFVTDRTDRPFGGTLGRIETHSLELRRMGSDRWSRLVGLVGVATAVPRARRLIDRLAPDVVVGFGGYPSLPTMFAAARAGVTTMIHEQNAVFGRANRLLASRVSLLATSFENVARASPKAHRVFVGNPVRAAFLERRGLAYRPAAPESSFQLLIVGGSQGARVFSDVVPRAIGNFDQALRRRLKVTQQTRPEDLERTRAAYGASGVNVDIRAFFDDIAERMANAHLVLCRSGASTCAEVTCLGRPAWFVPYPFATDDHQTANANAIAAAGGGWVTGQPSFTAALLAERLAVLMDDPNALSAAAQAAHRLGRPDAADRLADLVDRLANKRVDRLENAA